MREWTSSVCLEAEVLKTTIKNVNSWPYPPAEPWELWSLLRDCYQRAQTWARLMQLTLNSWGCPGLACRIMSSPASGVEAAWKWCSTGLSAAGSAGKRSKGRGNISHSTPTHTGWNPWQQQLLLSPVRVPLNPIAVHLLCSGVLRDWKPWI